MISDANGDGVAELALADHGIDVDLAAQLISDDGFGNAGSFANIENVTGTSFDDAIFGDNGANLFTGLGGADTLFGFGGDDMLFGGAGNDLLRGDGLPAFGGPSGNDTIFGEAGDDVMWGGAGPFIRWRRRLRPGELRFPQGHERGGRQPYRSDRH